MRSRTLFGAASAVLLLSIVAAAACSSSGSAAGGADAQGGGPTADPPAAKSSITRTPLSAVPASALSAAVAANNAIALDLYAHVLLQPGTNVLTSPLSASFALTMTYAGANGATKTEMATAMHLDPNAGDAAFVGQNALSQALDGRAAAALAQAKLHASPNAPPLESDYQLQLLNSVWGEKTYTWKQPFLDILAANYGSGVYQEDFIHDFDRARLTINDWVDTRTSDKIKNLLPESSLDENTRIVLVNAIHLKLPWAQAFVPEATIAGDFVRADSSKVSASFMNNIDDFGYLDDGQAQVVSLPLSNRELSVVIALPHEGVTLAQYEATLTTSSAPFVSFNASALIRLSLPKTTFTSNTFSLRTALQQMGMQLAFTGDADLSGLCTPADVHVSDVLQKTTISMREQIVEAAAATAVIGSGGSSAGPTPVAMIVNRPYLVSIIDNPTGAVLMLGHIQDPTDAGSP